MIFFMMPEEGDILVCEYCGKEEEATQDMNPWICVSKVEGGEEFDEAFFCSHSCLTNWVSESEVTQLKREADQQEDVEWDVERIIVKHDLWNKIEQHQNHETCAVCGKRFLSGDSAVFFRGKPIHESCII